MSFDEKRDPISDELLDSKTNQLDEVSVENNFRCQALGNLHSKSRQNHIKCKPQSDHELQGSDSSLSESREDSNERTDGLPVGTEKMDPNLNDRDKLEMLQNVVKTVGGDLEDIKTLMLRLRSILSNGCGGGDNAAINSHNRASVEESSTPKVMVIDDSDDDDDDHVSMKDSQRLHYEANQEGEPSRESSTESCFEESKYSTLITDIEVLKNKLVSLKRNLAE